MVERSKLPKRVRHGGFVLISRVLAWVPTPRMRARVVSWLGATVGSGVRIHDISFFNVEDGLSRFHVGDDAHVGTQCLFDLTDAVVVGCGAVLGPRVMVLTHQDAGAFHSSPVAEVLGTYAAPTRIGDGAFIGAGSILLCGVAIGEHAVVGAGSVVTRDVPAGTVVVGTPAAPVRSIRPELAEIGVQVDL